jgi:adenosine deaminase
MKKIADENIVLELCPTSNLRTGVIKEIEELRNIIDKLKSHKVKFCINSDGPEFLKVSVNNEFSMLYRNNILSTDEVETIARAAHNYSFIA